MEKKVFYKDVDSIKSETEGANRIAKLLEENRKRLVRMNKVQFILDESLVFELTTYRHGGMRGIKEHIRRMNPVAGEEDIDRVARSTTEPHVRDEHYPDMKEMPVIETVRHPLQAAGRKLRGEDFTFSKGKYKPTKELLSEIEEYHTRYIETARQAEYAAALEDLKEAITKVEKIHKEKGIYFTAWNFVQQTSVIGSETFELDRPFIAEHYLPLMK